jgi:hypothetical protein
LAERAHGRAAAVERIGVLRIQLHLCVVVGQREIVLLRALVNIAAMDERLGEARINPDRQVEVLELTTGLTDRRVGQTTRIECWRLGPVENQDST